MQLFNNGMPIVLIGKSLSQSFVQVYLIHQFHYQELFKFKVRVVLKNRGWDDLA